MPEEPNLSVVSWNIHRARGNDGVVDPARTTDVLCAEVVSAATDILVLQEADAEAAPQPGLLDLARIEAERGLVHAQTRRDLRWSGDSHGFYGVVVLTGPRVRVQDATVLDLPGVHPRGAVVLDATVGGRSFRLVATHLALSQPLRVAQTRVIGQHLSRLPARPVVLCGDLNEWRPWGGMALSRSVLGLRLNGPARPSFPVSRPVLPLDRILTNRPGRVEGFRVLDGRGIRLVSDHRPVAGAVHFAGSDDPAEPRRPVVQR